MALITIVANPAAGKSLRAAQIAHYIAQKQPHHNLVVISDHSLDIPRSAYDNSHSEKPARASLFAAVQRALAPDTIIILDSLNYIKGFRYQLYCAAREAKVRTCTVYIAAPPDTCREWNRDRDNPYSDETLEGLFLRFEEPSSMVRWDSPLFTVAWTDQDVPGEEIWQAITAGIVKPPNAGTVAVSKAPTNALQVLEQKTSSMVSAIMVEAGSGTGGKIVVSGEKLELPSRSVSIAELQRLKRQFITLHKKAVTLGSIERGGVSWGEEEIGGKFIRYLEEHWL